VSAFFPGFEERNIVTGGATIHLVRGGSGPAVLLLHGYPQNHVIWHRIAPRLAERYTVVAADLRGYGDSSKPAGLPDHSNYSKRAMAKDMIEAMSALGYDSFSVVGHDRGGRVVHRMALDHPARIVRAAVLDISPTRTMYLHTTREFATAYYHWFFLIRPAPLPETLIGGAPEIYLKSHLGSRHAGLAAFAPEALADYVRCFSNPATIHASCEDYRAAAGIDLEHDEADLERRIGCPLLVLWGRHGAIERYFNPLKDWAERASDLRGHALDCGHYLPEEAPDDVFAELVRFLS
jgi:haloacetate dehalogenase